LRNLRMTVLPGVTEPARANESLLSWVGVGRKFVYEMDLFRRKGRAINKLYLAGGVHQGFKKHGGKK